jgi:hypothetical protein
LFLDGVGFQVLFREQRERQRGLLLARNLLFHALILSQFPIYLQTYLTYFAGMVEHSLVPEYRIRGFSG